MENDKENKAQGKPSRKSSRRSSILKDSPGRKPLQSMTDMQQKRRSKRVSFADTKTIKEFLETVGNVTEWNSTYETPASDISNSMDLTGISDKSIRVGESALPIQPSMSSGSANTGKTEGEVISPSDTTLDTSNFLSDFMDWDPNKSASNSFFGVAESKAVSNSFIDIDASADDSMTSSDNFLKNLMSMKTSESTNASFNQGKKQDPNAASNQGKKQDLDSASNQDKKRDPGAAPNQDKKQEKREDPVDITDKNLKVFAVADDTFSSDQMDQLLKDDLAQMMIADLERTCSHDEYAKKHSSNVAQCAAEDLEKSQSVSLTSEDPFITQSHAKYLDRSISLPTDQVNKEMIDDLGHNENEDMDMTHLPGQNPRQGDDATQKLGENLDMTCPTDYIAKLIESDATQKLDTDMDISCSMGQLAKFSGGDLTEKLIADMEMTCPTGQMSKLIRGDLTQKLSTDMEMTCPTAQMSKLIQGDLTQKLAADMEITCPTGQMSKLIQGDLTQKLTADMEMTCPTGQMSKLIQGDLTQKLTADMEMTSTGQMSKLIQGDLTQKLTADMEMTSTGQMSKLIQGDLTQKVAADMEMTCPTGQMSKLIQGDLTQKVAADMEMASTSQIAKFSQGDLTQKLGADMEMTCPTGQMSKLMQGNLTEKLGIDMKCSHPAGQVDNVKESYLGQKMNADMEMTCPTIQIYGLNQGDHTEKLSTDMEITCSTSQMVKMKEDKQPMKLITNMEMTFPTDQMVEPSQSVQKCELVSTNKMCLTDQIANMKGSDMSQNLNSDKEMSHTVYQNAKKRKSNELQEQTLDRQVCGSNQSSVAKENDLAQNGSVGMEITFPSEQMDKKRKSEVTQKLNEDMEMTCSLSQVSKVRENNLTQKLDTDMEMTFPAIKESVQAKKTSTEMDNSCLLDRLTTVTSCSQIEVIAPQLSNSTRELDASTQPGLFKKIAVPESTQLISQSSEDTSAANVGTSQSSLPINLESCNDSDISSRHQKNPAIHSGLTTKLSAMELSQALHMEGDAVKVGGEESDMRLITSSNRKSLGMELTCMSSSSTRKSQGMNITSLSNQTSDNNRKSLGMELTSLSNQTSDSTNIKSIGMELTNQMSNSSNRKSLGMDLTSLSNQTSDNNRKSLGMELTSLSNQTSDSSNIKSIGMELTNQMSNSSNRKSLGMELTCLSNKSSNNSKRKSIGMELPCLSTQASGSFDKADIRESNFGLNTTCPAFKVAEMIKNAMPERRKSMCGGVFPSVDFVDSEEKKGKGIVAKRRKSSGILEGSSQPQAQGMSKRRSILNLLPEDCDVTHDFSRPLFQSFFTDPDEKSNSSLLNVSENESLKKDHSILSNTSPKPGNKRSYEAEEVEEQHSPKILAGNSGPVHVFPSLRNSSLSPEKDECPPLPLDNDDDFQLHISHTEHLPRLELTEDLKAHAFTDAASSSPKISKESVTVSDFQGAPSSPQNHQTTAIKNSEIKDDVVTRENNVCDMGLENIHHTIATNIEENKGVMGIKDNSASEEGLEDIQMVLENSIDISLDVSPGRDASGCETSANKSLFQSVAADALSSVSLMLTSFKRRASQMHESHLNLEQALEEEDRLQLDEEMRNRSITRMSILQPSVGNLSVDKVMDQSVQESVNEVMDQSMQKEPVNEMMDQSVLKESVNEVLDQSVQKESVDVVMDQSVQKESLEEVNDQIKSLSESKNASQVFQSLHELGDMNESSLDNHADKSIHVSQPQNLPQSCVTDCPVDSSVQDIEKGDKSANAEHLQKTPTKEELNKTSMNEELKKSLATLDVSSKENHIAKKKTSSDSISSERFTGVDIKLLLSKTTVKEDLCNMCEGPNLQEGCFMHTSNRSRKWIIKGVAKGVRYLKLQHTPLELALNVTRTDIHWTVTTATWKPQASDLTNKDSQLVMRLLGCRIAAAVLQLYGLALCETKEVLERVAMAYEDVSALLLELQMLKARYLTDLKKDSISITLFSSARHINVAVSIDMSPPDPTPDDPYGIQPSAKVTIGNLRRETVEEAMAGVVQGSKYLLRLLRAADLVVQGTM